MEYLLIQVLNGVQLGLLMFLLAAGLTLTFGIMDLVNLAHGSLYMMGAYIAWTFVTWTDSFVLGALLALPATAVIQALLSTYVSRHELIAELSEATPIDDDEPVAGAGGPRPDSRPGAADDRAVVGGTGPPPAPGSGGEAPVPKP